MTVDELFAEWLDDNGQDIVRDECSVENMVWEEVTKYCETELNDINFDAVAKEAMTDKLSEENSDLRGLVSQLTSDVQGLTELTEHLTNEVRHLQSVCLWKRPWWKFWQNWA